MQQTSRNAAFIGLYPPQGFPENVLVQAVVIPELELSDIQGRYVLLTLW